MLNRNLAGFQSCLIFKLYLFQDVKDKTKNCISYEEKKTDEVDGNKEFKKVGLLNFHKNVYNNITHLR